MGSQKEPKIDPKTTSKFKRVQEASRDRLEWIWSPLGPRVGEEKEGFLLENVVFGENRGFGDQEAMKSDLGWKMSEKRSPKGAQRGAQKGAQSEPRAIENRSKKRIRI